MTGVQNEHSKASNTFSVWQVNFVMSQVRTSILKIVLVWKTEQTAVGQVYHPSVQSMGAPLH